MQHPFATPYRSQAGTNQAIKRKRETHLDDAVVEGMGVERVLDVALPYDTQVAHHL